ncbi:MAG TPA: protein kinase [Sandaracinaceae bacterium LLY-WYZ-13_1]|nr:protein kinase [Sandaracinaceae bacterium LLY-WYZ-13_1]
MARHDGPRGLSADLGHRELTGTDRFEVRRRLGSGSFGVVYEGYDRERRSPVALKWLSYVDADTIYRFKREFRSLAEISHPNLVQLFDLSSDGDRWFFTMELVHGVALPAHLRPESLPSGAETLREPQTISDVIPRRRALSTPPGGARRPGAPSTRTVLDVEPVELRAVFRQLAQGVHALHEAGKLHRDLKCQNVLVTPDGRVVLLDFGLVREVGPDLARDELDIAGTPLYMAPEQCAGAPVGPPADWYAVGVMLFRALTGAFPFDGRMYEVMAAKQRRPAPRPSDRVRDVPPELDALCADLLACRPEDRPDGAEVLRRLGAAPSPRPAFPPRPTDVFVGRRRELRTLEAARRRVQAGEAAHVYVHGTSGIGKTALVRHFLSRLRAAAPDLLVLEGRCFERETLPYKALDTVIDSLATDLLSWPADDVASLLPTNVSDVVRIFPVLARVPAFRDAASPLSEVPDPQEQRRRAIVGFVDLLGRLAGQREVAIFIDDLQWGDRDSATLLGPLLTATDAPPVLWLGTFRTEEASSSPFLEALGVPARTDPRAVLVEVPELDEGEARTMLELRLSGTARDEELLDGLARDASGSPLLLDLLVRHARGRSAAATVDLGAVLEERMLELSDEARGLLEVLAIRGRPLSRAVAASVVGVDAFDVTMLTQLRNGRLLRAREADGDEELELYHDRIRTVVARRIDAAREQELHGRLARRLRTSDASDAESLAFHHRGAGDLAEALHYTVEAARRADAALAFERAAALYQEANELQTRIRSSRPPGPGEDAVSLRVALADALRNAGRGAAAAAAYLAAARESPRRRALELRRLAAEQYLFSGHLDEGRAVLRTVLAAVGLGFPEHPARAVAEFLARRAQVRLRGLRFREHPPDEIPEEALLRIDVCWSVSIGFAMIDPVRGGIFQARHLLMALDAGDPFRVARAVAVEVPFCATAGTKTRARTRALVARGRELADRAGHAYTHGLLASSTGGAAWLEGRWADALGHEEEALEILRRRCTGVAWELASSTIVLLDVLWRMGRWPELFERWPAVLADASSRGDLLLEIYLRIKFRSLGHLVEGRPEAAVREARDALARWSQPTFQLLHLWELFVQVEVLLYQRRPEAARERLDAAWPAIRRSQLLQLEMYEVTMRDLAGRVAVACATVARGEPRGRKRGALLARLGAPALAPSTPWADAEAAIVRLDETGAPWAAGPAALLRAGLATVAGDDEAARRHLGEAAIAFDEAGMALHARVARVRLAQLDGALEPKALEGLTGLGLAEPMRWLNLLAPGRWPGS